MIDKARAVNLEVEPAAKVLYIDNFATLSTDRGRAARMATKMLQLIHAEGVAAELDLAGDDDGELHGVPAQSQAVYMEAHTQEVLEDRAGAATGSLGAAPLLGS